MTIKNRFPDVAPTLNLDFANTKRLDPRITFTRASTGTYVDEFGIIRTAAANQARFDHDGSGNSLGLLIEEARTNLITYSEDFTQSSVWGLLDATVVPNSALSPSNNFDATLLRENATLACHGIRYPVTVGSGGTTTLSFFVKYVSKQFVQVTTDYSDMGTWNIDLLNLTANQVSGAASSVTLQQVASGWIQIRFTYTWNANNRWPNILLSSSLSMSRFGSYAGDGTSGIYIWGAQLESGAFPTSYIPTTGSTATRSADVASISNAEMQNYISSAGVTCLMKTIWETSGANQEIHFSDGAGSLSVSQWRQNSLRWLGVVSTNLPNYVYKSNLVTVFAARDTTTAVIGNDQGAYAEVAATLSLGAGDFQFGKFSNSQRKHHILKIMYYPVRLTQSQLQALTL